MVIAEVWLNNIIHGKSDLTCRFPTQIVSYFYPCDEAAILRRVAYYKGPVNSFWMCFLNFCWFITFLWSGPVGFISCHLGLTNQFQHPCDQLNPICSRNIYISDTFSIFYGVNRYVRLVTYPYLPWLWISKKM
jgi:hypothetical protein